MGLGTGEHPGWEANELDRAQVLLRSKGKGERERERDREMQRENERGEEKREKMLLP